MTSQIDPSIEASSSDFFQSNTRLNEVFTIAVRDPGEIPMNQCNENTSFVSGEARSLADSVPTQQLDSSSSFDFPEVNSFPQAPPRQLTGDLDTIMNYQHAAQNCHTPLPYGTLRTTSAPATRHRVAGNFPDMPDAFGFSFDLDPPSFENGSQENIQSSKPWLGNIDWKLYKAEARK